MGPNTRKSCFVVVLCSGLLAACVPQFANQAPEREEADLKTLVIEQRGAIEELRREQERLRASVEELQHEQSKTATRGARQGMGEDADPWYAGGRRPTPAVAMGAPLDIPYPDDADYPTAAPTVAMQTDPVPDYRAPAPTAAPGAYAGGNVQLPTVPDSLSGSIYEEGVRGLIVGDHDTAVRNFRDFMRANPSSPYADDAQFWVGESYFRKGQYHRAIIEFNQVVTAHSSGDKAPAALVRQAEVFRIVGDRVDARLSLQKVIKNYPQSPEAPRATRILGEMGG